MRVGCEVVFFLDDNVYVFPDSPPKLPLTRHVSGNCNWNPQTGEISDVRIPDNHWQVINIIKVSWMRVHDVDYGRFDVYLRTKQVELAAIPK